MDSDWLGLLELLLVFGLLLGFGFWQLWSLRRFRPKARDEDPEPPS